jgi:site-specific DNA recombinase
MQRNLDCGDVKTRKAYLTSVIDRIEVDDNAIRVFGRKDALADAVAGRISSAANVRVSVRKWCARA